MCLIDCKCYSLYFSSLYFAGILSLYFFASDVISHEFQDQEPYLTTNYLAQSTFQVARKLKLEFWDPNVKRQFLHGPYISRECEWIDLVQNVIQAGQCLRQYDIHGKFRALRREIYLSDMHHLFLRLHGIFSTYIIWDPEDLRVETRRLEVVKSTHAVHVRHAHAVVSVDVKFRNASHLGRKVLAAPSAFEEQPVRNQHHRVLQAFLWNMKSRSNVKYVNTNLLLQNIKHRNSKIGG